MNTEHVILPNRLVAMAFGFEWMGFILAMLLLLWAGGIIWRTYRRHHKPLHAALNVRLQALDVVAGQTSESAAQQAFADNMVSIDDAMSSNGPETDELRHAWTQFRETIVDDTQIPREATVRPEAYFLHLGDDSRILAWWANIFVALGLTATFLGIVAALAGAVGTVSGGSMEEMQKGLMGLLTMTATKFWTSIGGVGASIILRAVDRRWHSQTERQLESLCEALEYGTLFSPPQRLAARQLRELEQQSIALTDFSHQLAASIGDALGHQMQPVITGLSGIQNSINEFKDGSFNQIGKELGEAISNNAGEEMQALAGALAAMTEGIGSVTEKLDGASGDASNKIADAADKFASASDDMTTTVRDLKTSLSDMTREMVDAVRQAIGGATTESASAVQDVLARFTASAEGIEKAFDTMQGKIASIGQDLGQEAANTAQRNASVLTEAAGALKDVAAEAQGKMSDALNAAIARSGQEAETALANAFASFSTKFADVSEGLVSTLNTTAGRLETMAGSIERSNTAANDHAEKLSTAGREAQSAGKAFGDAARDAATATTPIREAVGTINTAVGRVADLLDQSEASGSRQKDMLEAMGTRLETTAAAAQASWEGYRDRFSEVDATLAQALNQIRNASSEHATSLNTEIGRIDLALAEAVDRLAPALDVLKDLADSLDDVRGRFVTEMES